MLNKESLEAQEFCVLPKKLEALKKRSIEAVTFYKLCPGVLGLMQEDHWDFLGCLARGLSHKLRSLTCCGISER